MLYRIKVRSECTKRLEEKALHTKERFESDNASVCSSKAIHISYGINSFNLTTDITHGMDTKYEKGAKDSMPGGGDTASSF